MPTRGKGILDHMAKMKICEIAKSLNMKSSDLIKLLNENGFKEAKAPQSNIEDAAIGWILQNVKPKTEEDSKGKKADSNEESRKKTAQKDPVEVSKEKKDTAQTGKEEKTEEVKTENVKKAPRKTYSTDYPDGIEAPEEKKEIKKALVKETKPVEKELKEPEAKKAEKPATGSDASVQTEDGRDNAKKPEAKENRSGDSRGRNEKRSENRSDNRNGQRPYNNDNRGRNDSRSENRGDNRNGQRPYNNDSRGRNDSRSENRGDNRNGQRPYNNDNRGRNDSRSENRSDNRNGQRPYNNDNRGRNENRNGQRSAAGKGSFGGGREERSSGSFDFGLPASKNNGGRGNGYNNKKQKEKEKNNWENKERQKKKDPNRKGAFIKPVTPPTPKEPEDSIRNIILPEHMTIKELADIMKQPPASVVKKLFLGGKMYSINQEITFEEAEEIALEYNCIAELEEQVDVIEELLREDEEDEALMKKRPPVVCVMGHVDHGKTSLLDAIRETRVTEKEAGGITQHIGAYVVESNGEKITFLDTPGHEAFTSMRMRGAQSTDIAILVVAADDGVMPQTVEAISHAKAAGVEIIVAINKIDKESANVERVKQELTEYELIPEDWGGSTIFVPVSAHTKEGIDQLLEMILLTAEVMELKSNPDRKARGIVIEAQLDKGRGPVATVLVQKGTLKVGDAIAIGSAYGKVRAMVDDTGRRVKTATPSTPVEIIGLNEVPAAGEVFLVTDNEKEARNIAETYIKQNKERLIGETKAKLSLDGLFSQIQAGNIKELNLIVKADVQGSVEAVKQSLLKLSNEEVAIRIIHGGVGAINESDVTLASASNAIIIGFNIRPDNMAKDLAEREKVDLRLYKVIYNAIEDVEAAMKGMLDPIYEEKVIGHAEVRQLFKASGVGTIAGSYVLDGKIVRGCSVRINREEEKIFEGPLASLKRFKDDVKEVASGYECGLVFEKFNDIKEGDIIEAYVMEEVPR